MNDKAVAEVQPDPFLEMVERVASNPDIDADKIQKILDMQIQVMDRTARDEFYAAMNRVQAELPAVYRDAENKQTNSRYSKIETIAKAIKPIYTKHGFSTSFSEDKSDGDGYIRIRGVLRHCNGHSEDHYYVDLPVDNVGIHGKVNKTMVHGTASTFQYGRRYLTLFMFNVTTDDDDDDGNAAGNPSEVGKYVDMPEEQATVIANLLDEANPETGVGVDKFGEAWLELEQSEQMSFAPWIGKFYPGAVSATKEKMRNIMAAYRTRRNDTGN